MEKEAIRKAVASRIDTLDEAFLVTLMGFVQASEAEGDSGMAGESHTGRMAVSGTQERPARASFHQRRLEGRLVPRRRCAGSGVGVPGAACTELP